MISVASYSSAVAPKLPAELERAMGAAATTAAIELFAAYRVAMAQVTPLTDSGAHAPISDLSALGIVRFTAAGLNGTAVLGASNRTLRRSNLRGTSDRDWVAELANQFVGRFKLKLLRAGVELWSMAPLAVSARLLVTAVSQPESPPFSFRDAQGGSVAVWIELDLNGPLKMTTPASEGELPREGDVILF
ncbi:MAG TPA: hypothetical protein VN903_02870 [Polyangia bacterium]|nr:hypothetical protein [Polyangia bacterium]